MAVNDNVQPGDMVVTCEKTYLQKEKPDLPWVIRSSKARLPAFSVCVVLEKVAAGSSGLGLVFKVMSPDGHVGWVWNYEVMKW